MLNVPLHAGVPLHTPHSVWRAERHTAPVSNCAVHSQTVPEPNVLQDVEAGVADLRLILKEVGMTVGHREKLLLALTTRRA